MRVEEGRRKGSGGGVTRAISLIYRPSRGQRRRETTGNEETDNVAGRINV